MVKLLSGPHRGQLAEVVWGGPVFDPEKFDGAIFADLTGEGVTGMARIVRVSA